VAVATQCRDLRKTYDGKVEAVRGLSLEIQTGNASAYFGPNGAGKTTTIEILEGRRGARCNNLITRQASHEDVFVRLTGRHLRED